MKVFSAMLLIAIIIGTISCDDCADCKPFTEEPFLEVRFLNKADSSKRIIIIDSVNQVYGGDLRHYKDTTSIYKFPLDMHHDTSVYQLVYRDTSDLQTSLMDNINNYLQQGIFEKTRQLYYC